MESSPQLRRRRQRKGGASGEQGQIVVENMALLPVVLIVFLLLWQLTITGWVLVHTGHAASQASSRYAASRDLDEAHRAATEAMPDSLRSGTRLDAQGDELTVRVPIPLLVPGNITMPSDVHVTRHVVMEPGR